MGKGRGAGPFGGLWVLCLAAVGVSLIAPLSALPSWDLCWFKALTHHPCPGCGLTHSFLAIGHGEWAEAWSFNPFGYVWYLLALYVLFRPVFLHLAPKGTGKTDRFLGSGPFFAGLVLSMFVVWAVRSFGPFSLH